MFRPFGFGRAGFCKEIGLVEWVNARFLKKSHNSHTSNGQLFVAMLLNDLRFVSRTLHVYPVYFKDLPTERLLCKGILLQHINDDVLRRFLDCLYADGESGLYEELVFNVVNNLGLQCKSPNLDAVGGFAPLRPGIS